MRLLLLWLCGIGLSMAGDDKEDHPLEAKDKYIAKIIEQTHETMDKNPQPLSDDDYKKPQLIPQVHEHEDPTPKPSPAPTVYSRSPPVYSMPPPVYSTSPPPKPYQAPLYQPEFRAPDPGFYPWSAMPQARYAPRSYYNRKMQEDPSDLLFEILHGDRHKRSLEPFKKVVVKDSMESWYDIDSGKKNEVSGYLMSNPGFATQQMWSQKLDKYGPAIHIGKIDRGYQEHAELSRASDHAFGPGYDFNPQDLVNSFKFQPHGLRWYSWDQFLEEKDKMMITPGQLLSIDMFAILPSSKCWKKEYVMSYEVLSYEVKPDNRIHCETVIPGVFQYLRAYKWCPTILRSLHDSYDDDSAYENEDVVTSGTKVTDPSCKYILKVRSIHDLQGYRFSNLNIQAIRRQIPTQKYYYPVNNYDNPIVPPVHLRRGGGGEEGGEEGEGGGQGGGQGQPGRGGGQPGRGGGQPGRGGGGQPGRRGGGQPPGVGGEGQPGGGEGGHG